MELTVSKIEAKQIKVVFQTIKAGALHAEGTFLQQDGSLFEVMLAPTFEGDMLSVWVENYNYNKDGDKVLKGFQSVKMSAKDIAKL